MQLENDKHEQQKLIEAQDEISQYKANVMQLSEYLQNIGGKTQATDELEKVLTDQLSDKIRETTQILIEKIRNDVVSKINLLLDMINKQDKLIENLLQQVSDTNIEKENIYELYKKVKGENEELDYIASTDALTGLKNVRGLEKEINNLMEKYNQNKVFSGVSICILDIDDFKKINDTHGHNNGDIVLKNLALLLINYFGPDIYSIFRKGGEEFIIISELNIEDFKEKINKFLEVIKNNALKIQGGEKVKITCSGAILNTKGISIGKHKPKNGSDFNKTEIYDLITSLLSTGLNQAKAIPGKGQIVCK